MKYVIFCLIIFISCSQNPTSHKKEGPNFSEVEEFMESAPDPLKKYDGSLSYLTISDTFPCVISYKEDTLLNANYGFMNELPSLWYCSVADKDFFLIHKTSDMYGYFHVYYDGQEIISSYSIMGFCEWEDNNYLLAYQDGALRAHNREKVICIFNPETGELTEVGRRDAEPYGS